MIKKILLAAILSISLIGCNIYDCLPVKKPTDKVLICHKSGNGFKLLTVAASAGQSHADHGDFLAPAGANKNSDCVIVVPPPPPPVDTVIVIPPVVPPVLPPVDTTVIPPVVVPPPPVPSEDDGVKVIPDSLKNSMPCLFDDSRPECLL